MRTHFLRGAFAALICTSTTSLLLAQPVRRDLEERVRTALDGDA